MAGHSNGAITAAYIAACGGKNIAGVVLEDPPVFYSANIKAYKAFYRINDGYIEVIRVLLAKMEYMKILFGESE